MPEHEYGPSNREASTVDGTWWVYFLECRDGSIYTGIAKDVDARFKKHASGTGARYTRMNPPIRVLAKQCYPSHRDAARAEWAFKQLTRTQKRQRIVSLNEP